MDTQVATQMTISSETETALLLIVCRPSAPSCR
jgi:hypothetical protein